MQAANFATKILRRERSPVRSRHLPACPAILAYGYPSSSRALRPGRRRRVSRGSAGSPKQDIERPPKSATPTSAHSRPSNFPRIPLQKPRNPAPKQRAKRPQGVDQRSNLPRNVARKNLRNNREERSIRRIHRRPRDDQKPERDPEAVSGRQVAAKERSPRGNQERPYIPAPAGHHPANALFAHARLK
jgi:hypothetical protein